KVRGEFLAGLGTPHEVRSHDFAGQQPATLSVFEKDQVSANQYATALELQGSMSQHAIGTMIGVSQATVGNWQSGKHEPRAISSNYVDQPLPASIEITPQLMKLFGYYTAEGRENGCLHFVFGTHESDLHADCIALMAETFGLEPTVDRTEDNSTRITYYSAPL